MSSATATAPAGPVKLAEWVKRAEHRMHEAGLFFGHGTETALDEACWMASHVLALPPDFDPGEFERRIDADGRAALDDLLARRIESRKPLAYLIGEAWFAGLRFEVDEHTLVPRSPLGELVIGGLMPWLDLDLELRVLDVGTGSGCIAVALAARWPALSVDAVDISEAALARARANAALHDVEARVRVGYADVFDGLDPDTRYDLIVSNPPYVPDESMNALPAEYRHEPDFALRAGHDGLDIVRRLLAGAPDRLRPGGWLLLEVGEAQPQTERLLGDTPAIWLEFEHGGEGVVLLDRDACIHWQEQHA